jgi:hypothetical protein
VREFSQTFVYGSQDPRVFDEAESFTLAPTSALAAPLNESSVACAQGDNADAGWACTPLPGSHRVCGHRGVFSFVSPIYAIAEAAGSITVTVQRSGGGLGRADLLYDLEHVTTTPGDVSPTMYYTSSQKLEFAPGVVALAFKLQIHDDHVLESDKTFRLRLREPFAPIDLVGVAPATLGNQWRTRVTIVNDDLLRPAANLSYVVSPTSTLLLGGTAGDPMTFQIQSVLGNGMPGVDPVSEAVYLMTSYVEEDDNSAGAAVFRALRLGTVVQSGSMDTSLLTCTWMRERAGNYTVAVQLLYPGGLRGEYFGDAWLGESYDEERKALPIISRIDQHVNFTWNNGPAFPGAQSHLSVRWSGWLKPGTTGTTMLGASVVGFVRLWIDDVLVIDRWGAGGETSENLPVVRAAAGVALDTSRYYSLVLEYRAPRQGDIYVRLLWGSVGSAKLDVIPTKQLFCGSHIQGSPFASVPVTPALTASAGLMTSTLRSVGASESPALSVIAGDTFAFSVLPRDVYGNRRRSADQHGDQRDVIAATLTMTTDRSLGGIGTKTEDALVSWNGSDDKFRVLARPQRSGDYAMAVTVNTNTLTASLFTVVVLPAQLNAARCVLSGTGLLAGRVAGQAVNVALETRDLYSNRIYTGGLTDLKLQAVLSASASPVVATGQIVDNADGTYKFTYSPRIVGSYSVAVTWRGIHLQNSPYAVTVIANTPVGSTSSAQGSSISLAKTNVQSTFEVSTRDSSGNSVPTGGAASSIDVVIEHLDRGNVSGNVCTDLLNGRYTCTFTPRYVGAARLHVKLSQQAIIGSPFSVDVIAGPALGSRCVATGDALVSAVAGQRTSFNVSIHDAFGNAKVNAGSESISVVFTGPGAVVTTVNAAVVATYAGEGIYVVTYVLNVKGAYKITVIVDGVAIISSPFTIYTYPATASPATTSLDLVSPALPKSKADPPLIFEAGALIVTRLTTRDSLGNTLETGGHFFHLDDDVRAVLDVPIADENSGSYLITLRPKRSVLYPFTPELMMPGGVNASYYAATAVPVGAATADSSPNHSLMILKRRDASINFDFGELPQQMYSGETFSVRWDGFLRPLFSEMYTFQVDVLGSASLRVGSASVAVRPGATSGVVKLALTAQTFVDLELNFSKPRVLSNASVRLVWSSLSQPREIVSPTQLFTSWRIVNNAPALDIKPAAADPTAFTPEFSASSVIPDSTAVRAVVDEAFVFIVVSRDSFSNKLGGEDDCTLQVLLPHVPSGVTQPDVSIVDLHDGSYKIALVPHLIGSFSLYVAALPDAQKSSAPAGGDALVAFLTPYNIEGSPFQIQVAPGSPSAKTSTLIGGGYVSTTAGVPTEFVLELRDSSSNRLTATMVCAVLERVRVKIKSLSNEVEVSARTSQMEEDFLSAQNVRVQYTATVAGLHAVLLSVDGGSSFTQKTATLRVLPNVATAATSLVSPNGASAVTAGPGLGPQISTTQSYTYHVTVRDAYGNLRDKGGDHIIARVHGPDSSAASIADLGNGEYVVTYLVALPGAYEIETRVAEPERGLIGLYYVDTSSLQRNLQSAVRVVDATIDFDWSKNVSMRGFPRVVWRGFLRPSYSEEYTLWVRLQSSTGSAASIYIDGQTIIDGLSTGETSGRVNLVSGRLHAITVEYRSASVQNDAGYLSLSWQSVRQAAQLIPTQALIAEASEILPRAQLVAVN